MILQNHDFNFIAYPLVSIKLANTILPTICSNSFYPYVIHLNQQTDLFVVALLFWGASIFENLHDFRYEGGAPISSGFQIPLVTKPPDQCLAFNRDKDFPNTYIPINWLDRQRTSEYSDTRIYD